MLLKRRLIAIAFLVICLCSCEYKLDQKNYRDLQKPTGAPLVDITLLNESDTIRIFTETEIACNFNLHGLKILHSEFSLQGKTWNTYSETAKFSLNPALFTPGYDTLILTLYTNSGNGSMADVAEAEGYKIVKKWLVLLDGRPAPVISLTKSITPEGYLKISWPKCDQYNFRHYALYSVVFITGISKIITDANSTFYVDSCYIGGNVSYRVDCSVKGSPEQGYGNQLYLDDPIPKLKFAEIIPDSLRIYWNKSYYNATYSLIRGDKDQYIPIFVSHTDTSFTIPSPGLGVGANFTLTTLPFKPNSNNTGYNYQDYKNYVLGKGIESNWPVYAYNRMEKVLYTSSYDDVHCYNINPFALSNSYNIKDLIYQKMYSCTAISTKVAVLSPYNIYVFPNRTLQDAVIIPYGSFGIVIDHFCMTDNDIIAIATNGKYEQIRISDKKVITSFRIDDYPIFSTWACITTSKNGKNLCVVTRRGLQMYSIDNGFFTKTYSDTRSYRSALFDENDENRLMLTFTQTSKLEFRDVSGFNLVKTVDLPTSSEVISNIDPESGYLLLTDYDYAYAMDITNSKLKFKIHSAEMKPRLYDNKLFTGDGYMLDISKYLIK